MTNENRGAGLTRRAFATLAAVAAATSAFANQPTETTIGSVQDAAGDAFARLSATRRLKPQSDILLGDLVWTKQNSRAALGLDGGTRVSMGPMARLRIDRYVAEQGGELVLGDGALVFDRADELPKIDLEVRTTFGMIGVRGTRFFAGPSRGVFGVFVERGEVQVWAAGVRRVVRAGEGVNIAARGERPSAVNRWGAERIEEAFRSVLG